MEQLVYNFYNINEDDYLKSDGIMLSLWNAKYIIDILEPSITFHISDDEGRYLQIKNINNTDITHTFTYYMQFIFLPELYKYLTKQKVICNKIITGFYDREHQHTEKTYEEVSAHLKKYFNIDKDPRELVSINENGASTTITKESWMDFLRTKKIYVLASRDDFSELRTWISQIRNIIIHGGGISEYLLGKEYFNIS
jgi:hypothetical protein